MTELLFVRHPFTPANNVGWNQQEGIRDIVREDKDCPIDVVYGEEQARETAEFLGEYLNGKKVLLLISPHYRTQQMAQKINNSLYGRATAITYKTVEALREINQGLGYATTNAELDDILGEYDIEMSRAIIQNNIKDENKQKDEREDKRKDTSPGIAFPYGESEIEVRKRLRPVVTNDLKQAVESDEYDCIIFVAHDTVNKWLYQIIYNELPPRQTTASVLKHGEGIIFEPTAMAAKGYQVDLEVLESRVSRRSK